MLLVPRGRIKRTTKETGHAGNKGSPPCYYYMYVTLPYVYLYYELCTVYIFWGTASTTPPINGNAKGVVSVHIGV